MSPEVAQLKTAGRLWRLPVFSRKGPEGLRQSGAAGVFTGGFRLFGN
jgi:hypothetical protein